MFEQKKRLKLLHKTTRVVKKSRVMNYKHDNKDIRSSGLKEELEGVKFKKTTYLFISSFCSNLFRAKKNFFKEYLLNNV